MTNELSPPDLTIEQLLTRVSELKAEELKYKSIKAELDELRYHIQLKMQASKTKTTEPVNGYMAVRKITKNLVIKDETALAEWLEDPKNVFDPLTYYKIDVTGIKTLAEERLRDYGELLPGTETVETETVAITPARGGKLSA